MLVDSKYVRLVGNIPLVAVLDDEKISVYFKPAETRLRSWVGDSAYDDAALTSPTDRKRAEALKYAEALLINATGLPKWNLSHTGTGLATERPQGQSSSVVHLSTEQVKTLVQFFLDEAERVCWPYMIDKALPEGQILEPAEEA